MNELNYTRAGRFQWPVLIEQQSTSVDTFGTPVPTDWVEFVRCRAEILPFVGEVSGFSIKPAPDTAVAPATINVRYGSGRNVKKSMRVTDLTTGEVYSILHVSDPERAQRIIQLACQVAT